MTFEWELAKRYREGVEEGRAEGRAILIDELLKAFSPEELIAAGISEEEIEGARTSSDRKN